MRASNIRPPRRGQGIVMRSVGRPPSLSSRPRIALGVRTREASIEEPPIDVEAIARVRARGCVSIDDGMHAFFMFCNWAMPSVPTPPERDPEEVWADETYMR